MLQEKEAKDEVITLGLGCITRSLGQVANDVEHVESKYIFPSWFALNCLGPLLKVACVTNHPLNSGFILSFPKSYPSILLSACKL